MNDKIGVIVPVYKTEKYIAECIESILAQTYTNFRLILVDDGTPDNAGKICDDYAKKDNRITVIHQENAGVTRARAAGVEAANDCEWITFIDSDDTITEDALAHLYSGVNDTGDIVINEPDIQDNTILKSEYIKELIHFSRDITIGPFRKIFRKKLFNSQTFSTPRNIIVGEDVIMNLRLAFASSKEKISVVHKIVYNYNIRAGSVTRDFKSTPMYEEFVHKLITGSIPIEDFDYYHPETIENRINNWRHFWGYKIYANDMKQTPFYIELEKDIVSYNYKMDWIDKLLFYHTNPILRFFTINVKKITNIFTRYHKTK